VNNVQLFAGGVLLGLASAAAQAQFVKGNEAVRVMPDGSKQVQTPPLPSAGKSQMPRPCTAATGCNAGPWLMVETPQGLRECTEAYARDGTCRDSSYGVTKLARLWVIKSGGTWLQCQYPDTGSRCVNMFARPPANLPFDAVQ
jgi:hypothetical protein